MSFAETCAELVDLHDLKESDYSPGEPYGNIRASLDWGIRPWVGAMIRASDKMKRMQTYAQTGRLANEGVEDAFKDLAVYAIIALNLWREEQ